MPRAADLIYISGVISETNRLVRKQQFKNNEPVVDGVVLSPFPYQVQ